VALNRVVRIRPVQADGQRQIAVRQNSHGAVALDHHDRAHLFLLHQPRGNAQGLVRLCRDGFASQERSQ
jgi:hypothetical protein